MRRLSLPCLACVVLAVVPVAGAAQTPSLDQVEQLMQSGQYQQARQAIAQWWNATPDPGPRDAARAHLLRGRLAVDPDSAETDYLAIALGFPTQPQAAEALLRLGQLLVNKGELQRAQGYLQRLAADYPGSDLRGPGLLWLARAYDIGGHRPQACNAARLGLRDSGTNPDLASLLHVEEASSCQLTSDSAAKPAKARSQPAPARRPAQRPSPAPATPSRGPYAVQVGAFRLKHGAEALAAKLTKAGHTARLVLVPNSDLLRVRVGRFTTSQDAEDLVRRLKAEGFPAVVVGDADHEHEP
ncbi:MAG: SPOR domain-containing protein [Gemmatimonadota bacterium]|jgi:tetratricopeptide (TPR) repeat protein